MLQSPRITAALAAVAGTAVVGVSVGVAHASRARQSATPLTVSVASAHQTSTRFNTIQISGRVGPSASLAGGNGSIILYRETRAGLQQLSFNGPQTHPSSSGAFSIKSTGEPTGTNTYVVQYVPSATGYAMQGVATEHITVR